MDIIPAVDILGGKVVRLKKGDYADKKVYSDNPVEFAKLWEKKGAKFLHIVDLDGAKCGKTVNLVAVKAISKAVKMEIELGGGIRDLEAIENALNNGVKKVILGTAVFRNQDFAREACKHFMEHVIFDVALKNGNVSVGGWAEEEPGKLEDYLAFFKEIGLKRIIYTDVSKDGMLGGPNYNGLEKILGLTDIEIVLSGGVSSVKDVKELKKYEPKGLKGVIIGKALYEDKIDLTEAINVS